MKKDCESIMSVDEMVRGLVRAAELKEQEEKGLLWDDESRRALAAARSRGWGKSRTGVLVEHVGEEELRAVVVCLCGSTRFYKAFQQANYEETMAGRIVLIVGFYSHSQIEAHGSAVVLTSEQRKALLELHRCKIDMADEILVLNVGGYVGEGLRDEINYAISRGKPVRWLEQPDVAQSVRMGQAQ